MADVPARPGDDTDDWRDRRLMAQEWRTALCNLGLQCPPVLFFEATGAPNRDLPTSGLCEGQPLVLAEALAKTQIVAALTRYSATAPLSILARRLGTLRGASMPGILRRMEQSALAADYAQVARKADRLAELLSAADAARVRFSTGHEMFFDLRWRLARSDNGRCTRALGPRIINLPGGEGFIVPYEGERNGEPSRTAGEIPVADTDGHYVLHVKENKITEVAGIGPGADAMRRCLEADPARRNIAELGLGCNDRAVVSGAVLEDEKAGMHWAFGRSEHLGGTVGPAAFRDPSLVIHEDVVYARESPIAVASLQLIGQDEETLTIMEQGDYVIF